MALQRLKPKKGSLALYLLMLAAAVAIFISLRECSSPRLGPRRDITAGGDTLNIAIEVGPMGVVTSADTLTGQYYNLVRQACDSARINVRFHPYTRLADALDWLDKGKCRLVVGDIPVTADLNEKYTFIDPGTVDRLVLVQPRDSAGNKPVDVQTDLARKTVWVAKGSPAMARLNNLAHEIGDTIIVKEDAAYGAPELVIMAALGELPGGLTVVSRSVATPLLKRYENLDASVEISLNQFRGWPMLRRDSLLRDSLTRILAPAGL
ncbi:MAG: transporter substrate-binding domain-containing protein [Muribaculaceae bacterium]|nr:transporter substrate-binding domain-containing protein [Muribaculaceae bacterium]